MHGDAEPVFADEPADACKVALEEAFPRSGIHRMRAEGNQVGGNAKKLDTMVGVPVQNFFQRLKIRRRKLDDLFGCCVSQSASAVWRGQSRIDAGVTETNQGISPTGRRRIKPAYRRLTNR